ncbi:MAG: zf-TFIIB domain-containing protein [Bryobacteraceae bacterium]|jgi:Zn-finger nucleic acid-binding protein
MDDHPIMDCPNCGAHMQLDKGMDSWSCSYCRTVYYSRKNEDNVSVLNETSRFACPVCSVPLAEAAIDGHKLYYCTGCRGSLIPVETFVSLLDDLRAKQGGEWTIARPADPRELQRQIRCPQCGRQMDTHFYGGPGNIVIDDCAACELNWLDKGELARIARAPEELV